MRKENEMKWSKNKWKPTDLNGWKLTTNTINLSLCLENYDGKKKKNSASAVYYTSRFMNFHTSYFALNCSTEVIWAHKTWRFHAHYLIELLNYNFRFFYCLICANIINRDSLVSCKMYFIVIQFIVCCIYEKNIKY